MSEKRSRLSASVVNGIIYVIGGEQAVARGFTEAYDPETDTWTTKADMNNRRMGHSTSAVDGRIYAIGGRVAGLLSSVEVFDTGFVPDSGTSVAPIGKLATTWGTIKQSR